MMSARNQTKDKPRHDQIKHGGRISTEQDNPPSTTPKVWRLPLSNKTEAGNENEIKTMDQDRCAEVKDDERRRRRIV